MIDLRGEGATGFGSPLQREALLVGHLEKAVHSTGGERGQAPCDHPSGSWSQPFTCTLASFGHW